MEIRPYTAADRPAIYSLLETCLGRHNTSRRDEHFWNWKHHDNPFGESILLLAEEAGRLAGLRAFLRWQWQRDGDRHAAVRAVDTATHPDMQGRGIFKRLTYAGLDRAREAGVRFVFNTPNRNSMPGYLKMGWSHVACLPMYIRPLRPARMVAALAGRGHRDPGEAVGEGARPASALLEDGPALESLLARDADLRAGLLTTRRTPAYLAWRYTQHPYVPYYAEVVREAGELAGAVIYRGNQRYGLRELMISDLLLAHADSALVRELLSRLRARVAADYLLAHFAEGSPHLGLLRRAGFFRAPRRCLNFTVRPIDEDEIRPDPRQLASWGLCLGDLEIF